MAARVVEVAIEMCHTMMAISYGMKKTLHIDAALLREARSASGAGSDTETVRLGLEALVRQAAYERLRALRGTEPRATDVRRRREAAAAPAPSVV
jgi:Arc/MetJ family transcription regulator